MAKRFLLFNFLLALLITAAASAQAPKQRPDVDLGVAGQFLFRITHVEAGSPAEAAGLKPGDIVTRIGTRPILSLEDLKQVVSSYVPGEIVEIAYERPQAQATSKQPSLNRTAVQLRAFSR